MKRSERMAALKAARKAKMEARRTRMADKKAKKTRPKTAADEAFKETFEKSGGMAAMAARRKARAATKPKTEKMNAETAATETAATGNAAPRKPIGSTVTPRNKPIGSTVTPRNKPKPPPKTTGSTDLTEYQKRQKERLAAQRKRASENMGGQTNKISSFFKSIFPGKSNKPPTDAKIEEANRLVEEGYRKNESINRVVNKVKNTFGSYIDTADARGDLDKISNFVEDLFAKDPIKVGDTIKRNPPNQGPYGPGIVRKPRELGSNKMKKGGKVKKGCSVKKGYKSGGKVRGAGCATKGVRPCKMR